MPRVLFCVFSEADMYNYYLESVTHLPPAFRKYLFKNDKLGKVAYLLSLKREIVWLNNFASNFGRAPNYTLVGDHISQDDFAKTWAQAAAITFKPMKSFNLMKVMSLEVFSEDELDFVNRFYASNVGQRIIYQETSLSSLCDRRFVKEQAANFLAYLQDTSGKLELIEKIIEARLVVQSVAETASLFFPLLKRAQIKLGGARNPYQSGQATDILDQSASLEEEVDYARCRCIVVYSALNNLDLEEYIVFLNHPITQRYTVLSSSIASRIVSEQFKHFFLHLESNLATQEDR